MTVINPPVAVQSRTDTNADDFRSALMAGMAGLLSTPTPRGGIVPGWGAGLSVAQRGAGANMSVDVGSGVVLIPSPVAGTGGWYVVNDATANLAVAAAHATLPRIDLVIARVADPQYHTGGDGLAAVKVVTGTAAASPVAPTPPTSDGAYVVLGQVAVAAAATSIVNANITLNTSATRPFTVAAGGILPVANAAARTAIASPHLGLHVIEADTACEYVWNGSAWVAPGSGAWTAFTPTWAQSSAVGFSANGSRYLLEGKRATVHYDLTANSAGVGGSAWALSLPVNARATSDLQGLYLVAVAGGTIYKLVSLPASTGTLNFQDTSAGAFGSAPAVTIANGDRLRGTIVYEAA